VRCWGNNYYKQLGNGDQNSVYTPSTAVYLGGSSVVRSLFAGYDHSAVILSTGDIVAWGSNLYGELGLGSSSSFAPSFGLPYPANVVPRPVNRTAVSLCFGMWHMCVCGVLFAITRFELHICNTSLPALLSVLCRCVVWDNGQVSCAGSAYNGPTGYGDTTTRSTSQSLASLPMISFGRNKTAVQIDCGALHTVVVLNDGTVRTFGQGSSGQLGIGISSNVGDTGPVTAAPPVPIPIGFNVRQVAAGGYHTCILANATVGGADFVFCAGDGDSMGAAIRISNQPRFWPIIVPLPSKPIAFLDAAFTETCVIYRDGKFTCFGPDNEHGNQGTGDGTAVGFGILPETVADLQVRAGLSPCLWLNVHLLANLAFSCVSTVSTSCTLLSPA
jgi:hypothetical protein